MPNPEKSSKKLRIQSLESEIEILNWRLQDLEEANKCLIRENKLFLAFLWIFDHKIRFDRGGEFADRMICEMKREVPRTIREQLSTSSYSDRFSL